MGVVVSAQHASKVGGRGEHDAIPAQFHMLAQSSATIVAPTLADLLRCAVLCCAVLCCAVLCCAPYRFMVLLLR
jgi:hypothetical protein